MPDSTLHKIRGVNHMDSFNFLNQSSIYSTMGIHFIAYSELRGLADYVKDEAFRTGSEVFRKESVVNVG